MTPIRGLPGIPPPRLPPPPSAPTCVSLGMFAMFKDNDDESLPMPCMPPSPAMPESPPLLVLPLCMPPRPTEDRAEGMLLLLVLLVGVWSEMAAARRDEVGSCTPF